MSGAVISNTESEEDGKVNICPLCLKGFKTKPGLSQHWTKCLLTENVDDVIANRTQKFSQQPAATSNQSLHPSNNCYLNNIKWSKFQIISDDITRGKSYQQFDVIETDASGDCLFSSVLKFLKNRKETAVSIPHNVLDLRSKVVDHISNSVDEHGEANFDKFQMHLIENLRGEIPSFRSSDTPPETLKEDYINYMSTPQNYGTTAELCAMAEIFSFGFYIIRQNDYFNYTCYDYCSVKTTSNRQPNAIVTLLFTGNVSSGHFRLLSTNEHSPVQLMVPGAYKLVKECTSSKFTSIAPVNFCGLTINNSSNSREPPNVDVNIFDASFQSIPVDARRSSQSPNNIMRIRVKCDTCGFIAKNERGLKVHSRIHATQKPLDSQQNPTHHFDISSLDEASLIRKFGELLYRCKCSIPLVRIIQKSVRTVVCQELTKVINYVAAKNNVFAWLRLLSFPHIVLNTISRSNIKGNHRLNIIRHNLETFSKLNDVPSLFNELLNLLSIERPKKPESQSEKLLIKIAQRKIGEGDIGGAVRVLCSQEGIAEYTPETIDKLKAKHPDEHVDLAEETLPHPEEFETSTEEIMNAIKHFPISSSSGIDGLRPRHLKDLISFTCGDASAALTAALAKLVNIIRSGKICPKLLPVFYGAALIALAKKNGDIRPIAIGLTWRRLAGKIACFSIKDDLAQRLAPIQNGFGVKGGAEAIVHAVRAFAEADHQKPMAIVKFDYKNAFNEVLRKFLLNGIRTEAPSLYPMMQQAYRHPSDLHYRDIIIQSKRGTQQGDPCASAGFCIALNKLTRSLSSQLNAWFLDDGTIGDDFETILKDVEKVLAFSTESGLELNASKCEVLFINASPEDQTEMLRRLNRLLPGVKVVNSASFQLLGAPILEESLSEMLTTGLSNAKILCKRLTLLDIHPALRVLRCSLSSPRFMHLLRTSPTFLCMNQLDETFSFYRSTFEAITNNKTNDTSWTQATLPLSLSGLGLRKLVDLARPAYFSSVFQSEELSNRILAKSSICALSTRFRSFVNDYPTDLTPTTKESRTSQEAWDSLHVKAIHNELIESSEPIDRARLLASSSKPSSKWLQAVPSHQLGLLLDNDAARIAVALRLGNKVCEPHPCICGEFVSSKGLHGLSCNKTKGKYSRHAEINKIISMAFSAAGLPNSLEPYGLSRRNGKRPDGITSYPWSHGKSLIWDVTVVDTVAATHLNMTSNNCGAAADQAERDKHNEYIELKQQYHFTPLAFESFGSIGPETQIFLKKLGKSMKKQTGEPRSLDFLLQRLSIAIQRGNAISVRETHCDYDSVNYFM